MEGDFGKCPIHKAHDKTREVLEDKLGYSSQRINLRTALDVSLSTTEPMADVAKKHVSGFEKMSSFEQELVIEYLLVADLLKRGLWNELKDTALRFVNSADFVKHTSEIKPGTSLENNKNKEKLSFGETIDTATQILGEFSIVFFYQWEQEMSLRKGGEDKMRFDELDAMCNLRQVKYGTQYRPGDLMRIGFSTGIEYPMGMLKSMPELLRASGKEIDAQTIQETFSKNLVSMTSQYASQDILSFQAISSALEPGFRMPGDYQPTNFSSQLFILDEEGKMHFKKHEFERTLEQIGENIHNTSAKNHVDVNRIIGDREGKTGDGKVEVPWKTCPALFGNQLADFDNFFEPIMKRIMDLQKEYT